MIVNRYETPMDVAMKLAKHAPREMSNVLDPSVGTGALLHPLVTKLKSQSSEVFCIDSDSDAIAKVKESSLLTLKERIRFVTADFLEWSARSEISFDCVVMNPPFAASKSDLRQLYTRGTERKLVAEGRHMSLEAAFVFRAVELLLKGGRLLAVLPSSIVMSESAQWLRDYLLSVGSIHLVHELPPRAFPSVEARMYLVVFDKTVQRRTITLLNHDLADPERLSVSLGQERTINRLDFGYHRAAEKMSRWSCQKQFGWKQLGEIAVILRGDVRSPIGDVAAIHTTDYSNGFWRRPAGKRAPAPSKSERLVRRRDLLIMRVGRNCHKTIARPISPKKLPCSDCVMIIRPNESRFSMRLLFSLKVLLGMDWSRPLLERGTGASYISQKSLVELLIPTRIHSCFPTIYASFVAAQRARSYEGCLDAIRDVRLLLDRRLG